MYTFFRKQNMKDTHAPGLHHTTMTPTVSC